MLDRHHMSLIGLLVLKLLNQALAIDSPLGLRALASALGSFGYLLLTTALKTSLGHLINTLFKDISPPSSGISSFVHAMRSYLTGHRLFLTPHTPPQI